MTEILLATIVVFFVVLVAQYLRLSKLLKQKPQTATTSKTPHLQDAAVAEIEAKLKAAYEAQIQASVKVFGDDLKATSARLGEQVSRLTTTVIEEELSQYQKTLEEVRHSATKAMEQINAAVEQQREQLRQSVEADLAAEQKRRLEKLDTKLGDVVSGYIVESLGGGVDLGAQMQFIVSSLEARKADIKKDLADGV